MPTSVISPELVPALLLLACAKLQYRSESPETLAEMQISGPQLLKLLVQWAWHGAWNLHSNELWPHTPQVLMEVLIIEPRPCLVNIYTACRDNPKFLRHSSHLCATSHSPVCPESLANIFLLQGSMQRPHLPRPSPLPPTVSDSHLCLAP